MTNNLATRYFRIAVLTLSLMTSWCTWGQSAFERELTSYCEMFLFISDGHVRELIEHGISGRSDSIYNSLGGKMRLTYFSADGKRIVFSPAQNSTIDFSMHTYGSDTLMCALLTTCSPWCNSLIYVYPAGAHGEEPIKGHRATVSTHIKGCEPIFVSATLSDDRKSIITSNETWRMLPADEQEEVVPQLQNDTIDIRAYYKTINKLP